jgi:hypothetical protein
MPTKRPSKPKTVTLPIGTRFGRLTVMAAPVERRWSWDVPIKCDCGTLKRITLQRLTGGRATRCSSSCAMSSKGLDVAVGDTINNWTVLQLISTYRSAEGARYRCLCRCKCGTEKMVWKSHLVRGTSRSCGCLSKQRYGGSHPQYTGAGELSGARWSQIVSSAEGRRGRAPIGISINITYAWNLFLAQDCKCALTGLPISLAYGTETTASLDRIDSRGAYAVGNVQWLHKDVNRMKNIFSQERFLDVCFRVARLHKPKRGASK